MGRAVKCRVWLRLGAELRDGEIDAFAQQFPDVAFAAGEAPAESEIVFTNSRLSDEIVAQLPALKWIHTTFGGGAAFRALPSVQARGITVTSSRGVQAVPLAEFTEACVLALVKSFPVLARNKAERRWDETLALDTLDGKVALFLGLGAVNGLAARRLRERGLRVRAIRRNVAEVPAYAEKVCGWDQLPALLAEADVVIVGLPAADAFRGRLGETELRAMKPTAHIVNLVTRGIIPDAVLARALNDGWIAGAACNVFETNPLPDDLPLWSAPNLIISPNIAQGDRQRWRKLRDVFTENLRRYGDGAALVNVESG